MSLGVRLREERARLGWTQSRMGELAGGAAKRTVIDWEHDTTSPTGRQLEQLAGVGLDACYVITGRRAQVGDGAHEAQESAPPPYPPVPAACAEPADLVPVRRHPLSDSHASRSSPVLALGLGWLHAHLGGAEARLSAVRVIGDAMSPTLLDGDDVVVDELDASPARRDGVYAIALEGGLRIRRMRRRIDGALEVWADHPAHRPEVLPAGQAGHLRVVGRVVWPRL